MLLAFAYTRIIYNLQWQTPDTRTPEDHCLECQLYYSHCECSDSDINDDELYRNLRPSDFDNHDISWWQKHNFTWDDFYNKFGEEIDFKL